MSKEIFDKYGADPLALFRLWYAEAEQAEPNDPEAVCLATCDAAGNPSARMVLCKDADGRGFKFHTNSSSRKGSDIAENARAALCFYWKSLRRQIRVDGTVEMVPPEESDAYFNTRPRERQIGAWASAQSTPFEDLQDLETAIAETEQRFSGVANIPRPPQWNGYRIIPHSIEFWIAHRHRLHTRFVYTKNSAGGWDASWLYP